MENNNVNNINKALSLVLVILIGKHFKTKCIFNLVCELGIFKRNQGDCRRLEGPLKRTDQIIKAIFYSEMKAIADRFSCIIFHFPKCLIH